jgi:phage protein D
MKKFEIKLRTGLGYIERKLSNGVIIDTINWSPIPEELWTSLKARDMAKAARPEGRSAPEFEFREKDGGKK